MADNILLEVVTPERNVVSERAQIVMAPGYLGEFGVLPGHTSFITTLKDGTLKYRDVNGAEHRLEVFGGFAEALPDKVTILAEKTKDSDDLE